MMKNSSSVKTIIRKDKMKKNGMCPLYLSIIVNGKQLKLPTGKEWNPKFWGDRSNSYPKGFGSSTLKKILQSKEQHVRNFINKLEILGENITLTKIKNYYNGATKIEDDFYYQFDEFTKKKFLVIKKGTQNHYLLLKKQLKEYKPELKISEITYRFLKDFFYYLENDRKIGNGGLATRRKNLITVLNEFEKLKLIEKNYCSDIARFKENARNTFLTKIEVEKIKKANLELGRLTYGLNLTRDKFLFGCYTGLRYSDVENLTVQEVINNTVIKVAQKNEKEVSIPLIKEAISILKKYNYKQRKGKIFPKRSNVSVNRDLKIISRIAKIDISKNLTFHVSRHTFGSTLANEGVQPFYIMKLMGHSDVRMTNIYVNSNKEILHNVMEKVNFKVA